ncbi:MAG: tRNA-dihydrouridine synthase [Pseudothermotoga sp.]
MKLNPPLIIASGVGGMGEYLKLIDAKYIGAYTLKTITLLPKEGNPPPRLFATNNYLINSIGLENIGIEAFTEKLVSGDYEEIFAKTKVIASLGGDDPEQLTLVAQKIKPYESLFEAIEFNFSCPNVAEGGLKLVSDQKALKEVLKSIRKILNGFLIAKLSIEGIFVEELSKLVNEYEWNGVTVTNTIRALQLIDGNLFKGGISGPVLKPISLRAVYEIKNKVADLYTIACGGIMNEKDADDFFKVGADAVSVGSAIYKDPEIVERIAKHIWRCGE